MSRLRLNIAMSLDGFVAGPDQSPENPLGIGGMGLHEWAFALVTFRESHGMEGGEVNESTAVVEERLANIGATVMGRNMFGGGPGPWGDHPWTGWWGDDPPFHHPVLVVTHHAREPLALEGGTTFTFVTDGIASALDQARTAAAGKDVSLGGGPRSPGRTSMRGSSVRWRSTWCRSSWATASASSTAWAPDGPSSRTSGPSRRRGSPT